MTLSGSVSVRSWFDMKKRGFTLIELLVVIAIIAILAAMIMPVMLEAKDAAKMKRCVGNIRQLGQSIQMYMDEHDGFGLPLDMTATSHSYDNPWVLYVKPLRPYVGQVVVQPRPSMLTGFQQPNVIWVCQGDICRGNPEDENNRPCWWHWGSSYLYPGPTAYIGSSQSADDDPFSKSPNALPRKPQSWLCPRRDILLADYWFDFHSGYRVDKDVQQPTIFWPNKQEKNDVRCMNVVFLDLHAAAVTPTQRDVLINNVRITDNPFRL